MGRDAESLYVEEAKEKQSEVDLLKIVEPRGKNSLLLAFQKV
jgi:hypothetical protein